MVTTQPNWFEDVSDPSETLTTGEGSGTWVGVCAAVAGGGDCAPQHHNSPAVFTAHVDSFPTAISVASVNPVETGVSEGVVVPSPSWPLKLKPQQNTSPSEIAHVCAPPR